MDNLGLYALGFVGQGLFGARLVVQLYHSERQNRVVSPTVFWQLSLAAAFLFLIYGLLRSDPVIVLGQTLSYYIYIRNLQLKNAWAPIYFPMRLILMLLPVFAGVLSLKFIGFSTAGFAYVNLTHPIMILGAIGQLALNLRFVYQWYFSEATKESVLPVGFWHISVWASVLVIIYSLFHPVFGYDPVLLVSQSLGIVVYIRNLVLFKKARQVSK